MQDKILKDFLPDKNSSYYKKCNNSGSLLKITEEQVIECIRTVVDPEIPVNLYDLGLIYKIIIFRFLPFCCFSLFFFFLSHVCVCVFWRVFDSLLISKYSMVFDPRSS